jgi:O-acetylhomoserine/O-acetylserine sulfhydrylase-like pyridoxal-dependent enzyme
LYGGSVTMLAVSLAKFGIETTFVDATQPEAFAAAMRPNTRAVYAESLGNPSMVVLDIAAVAEVAHAHGVPLIIDNTVPSPLLCNPLALGADIVVHSATKYLAGHGTTLGGVVGQRQVSGHDRAVQGLPRCEVLRDLWRLWFHHALPHGKPARVWRGAQPHERLADFAGR